MKNSLLKTALVGSLAFGLSSTSYAGSVDILSISGATGSTSALSEVVKNPNTDVLSAWNETESFTLTESLSLDSGGVLAAGTVVSSYFLFWDPSKKKTLMDAQLQFEGDILGLIYKTDNIYDSNYLNDSTRFQSGVKNLGLEKYDLGNGGSTTFSGDTLDISWRASSPGDSVRVITSVSPVPEPSTYALMLAGLGLVGFMARRRKA